MAASYCILMVRGEAEIGNSFDAQRWTLLIINTNWHVILPLFFSYARFGAEMPTCKSVY
jgi:hypothetical protein